MAPVTDAACAGTAGPLLVERAGKEGPFPLDEGRRLSPGLADRPAASARWRRRAMAIVLGFGEVPSDSVADMRGGRSAGPTLPEVASSGSGGTLQAGRGAAGCDEAEWRITKRSRAVHRCRAGAGCGSVVLLRPAHRLEDDADLAVA